MAQNKWIGPANNGDAAAQYALGKMHQLGYINDFGQKVPQDDAAAASWFRAAAEQGHVEAQFRLGQMFHQGIGLRRDIVEAVGSYSNVVGKGDGLAYLEDDAEAVRWYTRAAEQGHARAQSELGEMYATGSGVEQNDIEAVRWFAKAAERSDDVAMSNLALMYYDGRGVPKDHAETARWLRRAGEQGLAQAQYNLACLYANGDGVPQDHAEAVLWYKKAADQGLAEARRELDELRKFKGP